MLGAAATLPLLPGHPGIACPLRRLTGIPCPLCGMTTGVEEGVRLHLGRAFAANPGGLVAVVAAVMLLVLRPARVRIPARCRRSRSRASGCSSCTASPSSDERSYW